MFAKKMLLNVHYRHAESTAYGKKPRADLFILTERMGFLHSGWKDKDFKVAYFLVKWDMHYCQKELQQLYFYKETTRFSPVAYVEKMSVFFMW